MEINLNMYQTLAAAVAVFFLGGFLKTKIKLLRKYCIPAPVIGGTIFSILNCILYTRGIWTYTQDTVMQNWCMMLFFTSIGYMASVHLIRKGGLLVIKMALLVGILIIMQNLIGISLSRFFGENPLMGLADGSIPWSEVTVPPVPSALYWKAWDFPMPPPLPLLPPPSAWWPAPLSAVLSVNS